MCIYVENYKTPNKEIKEDLNKYRYMYLMIARLYILNVSIHIK